MKSLLEAIIINRCVADGDKVQVGVDAMRYKNNGNEQVIECPFCGARLNIVLLDNDVISVVCEELE